MNMNYPWLDEYCLAKRGATKDFKEEWKAIRFMVGGKIFVLQFVLRCGDNAGRPVINVKLLPADGYFFRNQFKDIFPGYGMHKDHWNSVCLDGSVADDILREMVDKSYSIVFASLAKKAQKEITGCQAIANSNINLKGVSVQ